MSQTPRPATPLPVGSAIPPASLRAEMERRRAHGGSWSLAETVAILVPLCTEIAARHARGERLFVHPSSILLDERGAATVAVELATTPPAMPRDRACMAPEERHGEPGDARASVYTVGALLYELVTGEHIGPGMRRPSELVPGLDPAVEVMLGKALVADPAHRPDDLSALAQALHHLAPAAAATPPAADESHLDHSDGGEVDVSLSMLPPPPAHMGGPAFRPPPAPPRAPDATARLSDLKARLESDPRPRYVVVKSGMDHGPFTAVELLQQIGSHQFEEDNDLRDAFSQDERPIKDWEEFAPFAEQAKMQREVVAEKKEIERVVVAETKGTRQKTLVGVLVVGAGVAALAFVVMRVRATGEQARAVDAEQGIAVEFDGGLKSAQRARPTGGGGFVGGGGGGLPVLAGGMSCEAARDKYVEEIRIGGGNAQADLTAGQFGSVLNSGSYVVACGTPQSMHVTVCAAVQNGRAVGVTVSTDPPSPGVASCIAGAVRRMSFPSNPKLDIATTRF